MSSKINKKTSARARVRFYKKIRIKKKTQLQKGKVSRLVITKSNKFLYAQLVDDLKGHTIAFANTQESHFDKNNSKKTLEVAKELGKLVGKRAIEKNVTKVVFDRNGYNYHGRVKAVADGARGAGLNF